MNDLNHRLRGKREDAGLRIAVSQRSRDARHAPSSAICLRQVAGASTVEPVCFGGAHRRARRRAQILITEVRDSSRPWTWPPRGRPARRRRTRHHPGHRPLDVRRRWTDPSMAEAPRPTCDRLWTFQDVSDFLGVPIGTLYQWRVRGEGPPAFKVGRHVGSTRIGCGPGSQTRRSDVASAENVNAEPRSRGSRVGATRRVVSESAASLGRSTRSLPTVGGGHSV